MPPIDIYRLTAILACCTVAAASVALLLFLQLRRARAELQSLAALLSSAVKKGWWDGTDDEPRTLKALAAAGGFSSACAQAALSLTERLSKAQPLLESYERGCFLPPSFVPRFGTPDGVLRGMGNASGPGCEAVGYLGMRTRHTWMDFQVANPRYAYFAFTEAHGGWLKDVVMNSELAALIRHELNEHSYELHRPEVLPEIMYRLNGSLSENGRFKGGFAAALLGIWDSQEKEAALCGAGFSCLWRWDASSRTIAEVALPATPALGPLPNDLVKLRSPFSVYRIKLSIGDRLFLFGDLGQTKAVRDSAGNVVKKSAKYPVNGTIKDFEIEQFEHFDSDRRIESLLAAVGRGSSWRLEKEGGQEGEDGLVFDFSSCVGPTSDFVLAISAAERIFRMYQAPGAGPDDRIFIDAETDEFLVKHFNKLSLYRKEGLVRLDEDIRLAWGEGRVINSEGKRVIWSGIREDEQYGDISILALGRMD